MQTSYLHWLLQLELIEISNFMIEDLQKFVNIIQTNSLKESKSRINHPEDMVIFNAGTGAKHALDSIVKTSKHPNAITIKWDGYPALIFGYGNSDKFSIMDKHMFDKKDGSGRNIHSPLDFVNYDKNRGVERTELHKLIARIWPSLEKACAETKGYYWGDLLFSHPLEKENGVYTFKANPNGITYVVDADSDMGKMLANKIAGIAVHQYLGPDAVNTEDAISLNGTIGKIRNNTNVAIIPSAMPKTPAIKLNNKLIKQAQSSIHKYSKYIEKLMNTAPQAKSSFHSLFTTFITHKILTGNLDNLANDFLDYFENKSMTLSMKKKLADHLNNNKEGVLGLFTVWKDLYQLKMNLLGQLNSAVEESPVRGYLDSGQPSQEGFVSHGLKFVDRLGFTRQNFSGNR